MSDLLERAALAAFGSIIAAHTDPELPLTELQQENRRYAIAAEAWRIATVFADLDPSKSRKPKE